MLSTFVIAVAASALPPETALMASFTTGESAIGSLNVAVIVNTLPDFAALAGEYVRAAVGAVVSIRTALVFGVVKLRLALLPGRVFDRAAVQADRRRDRDAVGVVVAADGRVAEQQRAGPGAGHVARVAGGRADRQTNRRCAAAW